MIYRTFGKTGWRVSVVGLGTWNLGNQWGELSDQEATDIILAAIDNGMNLLDAAESYGIPNGMSELRIGKTLTPSMRDKLIIYCTEKNLGILVRGPLAKGVLSGKYNRESVFGDTVRDDWNPGQSDREEYEDMLDKLEAIREAIGDDSKLVETALRYVISHKSNPIVIPGATKVEQVIDNAQAGAALLDENLYRKLGDIGGNI